MMLGDDIVIYSTQLAEAYEAILLELDVPISPEKSHKSHDLFEFAKRWRFKGEEITPFPVHALLEIGPKY